MSNASRIGRACLVSDTNRREKLVKALAKAQQQVRDLQKLIRVIDANMETYKRIGEGG